jgi:exosortase
VPVSASIQPVNWKEAVPPAAGLPPVARAWGVVVAFGLIWGLVIRILSLHWAIDPQYGYGWMVPALCLYAAFRRWKTRPGPGAPAALGYWIVVGAAFALLPTWLIVQPNPDWRIINWLLTAEAVAATLGAIALGGGWSWMVWFGFPVCLMFTAVPWPRPLELYVVNLLMRGVTSVTVDVLNAAGTSALDHGNLIELKNGWVGVEEACSGIQSLQVALMASLVLGELSRLRPARRAGLVVFSMAAAVVTNVGRTLFLSLTASVSGIDAMERWHDPAAFSALGICFVLIWAAALFLAGPEQAPEVGVNPAPGHHLDARLVAGAGLWVVLVIAGTEAWYYDTAKPPQSPWELVPPSYSQPWALSKGAAEQLMADRTETGSWNEPDGGQWKLIYLEWKPGPMRSRILAMLHNPRICMPSAGYKMLEDRGTVSATSGSTTLAFHAFTFRGEDGAPLYVYYGEWQNRSARGLQHGPLAGTAKLAGIEAVLWRERYLGQQVAELAASGYPSAEASDAALGQVICRILVPRAGNQEPRRP